MKRITVGDAKPGMILAKPLLDASGRSIVNAGATLTQLYISRLGKWGVAELYVEEAGDVPGGEQRPGDEGAEAAQDSPGVTKAAGGVPPGVYRGPDLEDRIVKTFARVEDDPLMAALRDVAIRRLARGARGE